MQTLIKQFFTLCILATLVFLYSGCTVKWTEAIQYGSIEPADFTETLDFEIKNGLVFVPIKIQGKTYRFLLDTGAPFSISEALQSRYGFEVVSQGHIVDSDHNRKAVNYVQVDTLLIGSIPFINQTAFVGNFTKNPVFQCLGIDGIIGSNLMRHCNWAIDQKSRQLTLSSGIGEQWIKGSTSVPFKTDFQYNILVDIGVGEAKVKSMTLDFGSNGALSMPSDVFSFLKEQEIIDSTYYETGTQQAGIIGTPVNISTEHTISDSVNFNGLALGGVAIRTSPSSLIGTRVLSRFIVTIDWGKQQLYLNPYNTPHQDRIDYGFKIGYTEELGIHIRSVIKGSNAYKQGIRPGMKVLKINSLDFQQEHQFCDYVQLMQQRPERLLVELLDEKGRGFSVKI